MAKGRSAAYMKALRKKYGLGEFRKRPRTRRKSRQVKSSTRTVPTRPRAFLRVLSPFALT